MTLAVHRPIELYQFPRPAFAIPNLSPFCCKLETWLRMAGVRYEIRASPNPRKSPTGKMPFINDSGTVTADSSRIIEHLSKSRGIDLDAHLSEAERATSLLVQRILEEHYAFVVLYTHFIRPEGWRHTRATFNAIPAPVRPLVIVKVRSHMKRILWAQGLTRHSDGEIMESAIRDWRAVLASMSDGPFFFGARVSTIDAVVFGPLATTVFTPIESPVRAFLRGQPRAMAYAERMRAQYFPELSGQAQKEQASLAA